MATSPVTALTIARDVRAILREFVRDFIRDAVDDGEVLTVEAVESAEAQFLHDDEFAEAAVRDAIRAIVPNLIREQVKRDPGFVETARGAISGKRLEKTARERMATMFESVGPGHYKNLLKMRRPEITLVIDERKRRVATELQHIKGLREIAKALPDAMTTVGELPASRLQQILTDYFQPAPSSSPLSMSRSNSSTVSSVANRKTRVSLRGGSQRTWALKTKN